MKEYRTLGLKTAEVARFKSTLQNLCTPEMFQRTYPVLEKVVDRAVQGSLALAKIPAEEFDQYIASKPDLAKQFTENIALWEVIRSSSATLLEQKQVGNEALVMLEVLLNDPLTNQTTKKKALMHLIKVGVNKWKIAERELSD